MNDIRDWLSFLVGLVSLAITLSGRRGRCHRERYRSFKGWGIEWTSYDRKDDSQS